MMHNASSSIAVKKAERFRYSPQVLLEAILEDCQEVEANLMPIHRMITNKAQPGKNPHVGELTGVVYQRNTDKERQAKEYCIVAVPVLDSPKAEFGYEKQYEGAITRNVEEILLNCYHLVFGDPYKNDNSKNPQSLREQIMESKNPGSVRIAIPIATNSVFRAHWMGCFLDIDIDTDGKATITAKLVDSQSGLASLYTSPHLAEMVKRIFNTQLEFEYLGQQELTNLTDCGPSVKYNTKSFLRRENFITKIELSDKLDNRHNETKNLRASSPIENIPTKTVAMYDRNISDPKFKNIFLEQKTIDQFNAGDRFAVPLLHSTKKVIVSSDSKPSSTPQIDNRIQKLLVDIDKIKAAFDYDAMLDFIDTHKALAVKFITSEDDLDKLIAIQSQAKTVHSQLSELGQIYKSYLKLAGEIKNEELSTKLQTVIDELKLWKNLATDIERRISRGVKTNHKESEVAKLKVMILKDYLNQSKWEVVPLVSADKPGGVNTQLEEIQKAEKSERENPVNWKDVYRKVIEVGIEKKNATPSWGQYSSTTNYYRLYKDPQDDAILLKKLMTFAQQREPKDPAKAKLYEQFKNRYHAYAEESAPAPKAINKQPTPLSSGSEEVTNQRRSLK